MADKIFKVGTLFISKEVLQLEKWMQDQVISVATTQLYKYKGQDGYLKTSPVRLGDFSLLLTRERVTPVIATFIGIPGRSRAAIIEELFVAD